MAEIEKGEVEVPTLSHLVSRGIEEKVAAPYLYFTIYIFQLCKKDCAILKQVFWAVGL